MEKGRFSNKMLKDIMSNVQDMKTNAEKQLNLALTQIEDPVIKAQIMGLKNTADKGEVDKVLEGIRKLAGNASTNKPTQS